MDVSAKTGTRAWLMGAATAGLIAPGLLLAQVNQPATIHANPGDSDTLVAETEVEQQLRMLYERDGREMPNMQLSQMPATQPQPSPPANIQPQYSAGQAAAPQKSGNRFTSFFKRLIPGSKKPAPMQHVSPPPRQLPPLPQQAGVQQPQPIPGNAKSFPQPIPPSPPLSAGLPQSPTVSPAAAGPSAAPATTSSAIEEAGEFDPPRAPETRNAAAAEDVWGVAELKQAEESGKTAETQSESSPVESMPPTLDDDFPDPFGAAVETQPEQPEIEEPYTGKSLTDEEAPAALPFPKDVKPVTESTAETPLNDESADRDETPNANEKSTGNKTPGREKTPVIVPGRSLSAEEAAAAKNAPRPPADGRPGTQRFLPGDAA